MNYIRHIVEPHKVLVAWQVPGPGRKKKIVAEIIKENDIRLEYLTQTNDYKEALALGFTGYPGLPVSYSTHADVMDVFLKRLPPRTRDDFKKYLNALRIPKNIEISDIALLGYSGARLPDDDFVFIHPFDTAEAPFEFLMPIPGPCNNDASEPQVLKEGTSVTFEKENNSSSLSDIEIKSQGKKIANVDPVLLPQFNKWIDDGLNINAFIERINGTADKTRIYLFVSLKP